MQANEIVQLLATNYTCRTLKEPARIVNGIGWLFEISLSEAEALICEAFKQALSRARNQRVRDCIIH